MWSPSDDQGVGGATRSGSQQRLFDRTGCNLNVGRASSRADKIVDSPAGIGRLTRGCDMNYAKPRADHGRSGGS